MNVLTPEQQLEMYASVIRTAELCVHNKEKIKEHDDDIKCLNRHMWISHGVITIILGAIGFISGICLDMFTNTPGLHAAVASLMGYIRPTILNLLVAQEVSEDLNREPSVGNMGWGPYFIYILILTFIHHFYLVLLEWLQFGDFGYFIGKVTATTLMSILLILLPELITNRRKVKR